LVVHTLPQDHYPAEECGLSTLHSKDLEEGKGNCRQKTWERSSASSQLPPISLLSVYYKLLECLALQCISPTVEGILSPDHAGFRKDRSTCNHIAALTSYIESGFQQNLKTGVVFLDLSAA